jgi:hypothetical protein
MFVARRLPSAVCTRSPASRFSPDLTHTQQAARSTLNRRLFHYSPPALVTAGDRIPDVDLMENSPGTKLSLAKLLKEGKGVIVGR